LAAISGATADRLEVSAGCLRFPERQSARGICQESKTEGLFRLRVGISKIITFGAGSKFAE